MGVLSSWNSYDYSNCNYYSSFSWSYLSSTLYILAGDFHNLLSYICLRVSKPACSSLSSKVANKYNSTSCKNRLTKMYKVELRICLRKANHRISQTDSKLEILVCVDEEVAIVGKCHVRRLLDLALAKRISQSDADI
jgi:hypothetical protein